MSQILKRSSILRNFHLYLKVIYLLKQGKICLKRNIFFLRIKEILFTTLLLIGICNRLGFYLYCKPPSASFQASIRFKTQSKKNRVVKAWHFEAPEGFGIFKIWTISSWF